MTIFSDEQVKTEPKTELVETPAGMTDAEAEELAKKINGGLKAFGDAYHSFDRRRTGRVVDRFAQGLIDIIDGLRKGKKAIEEGRAEELLPGVAEKKGP